MNTIELPAVFDLNMKSKMVFFLCHLALLISAAVTEGRLGHTLDLNLLWLREGKKGAAPGLLLVRTGIHCLTLDWMSVCPGWAPCLRWKAYFFTCLLSTGNACMEHYVEKIRGFVGKEPWSTSNVCWAQGLGALLWFLFVCFVFIFHHFLNCSKIYLKFIILKCTIQGH